MKPLISTLTKAVLLSMLLMLHINEGLAQTMTKGNKDSLVIVHVMGEIITGQFTNHRCQFLIYNEKGELVRKAVTNHMGLFSIHLYQNLYYEVEIICPGYHSRTLIFDTFIDEGIKKVSKINMSLRLIHKGSYPPPDNHVQMAWFSPIKKNFMFTELPITGESKTLMKNKRTNQAEMATK